MGTVHTLITCNPDIDFRIEIKSDTQEICLDTQECSGAGGGYSLKPARCFHVDQGVFLEEAMKQANIQA